MDSNSTNITILLVGSGRISKLIPALEKADEFKLTHEIWEGGHGYRTPSELWRLRNHILEFENTVVLTDSMGIQAFQAGLMANYYNVPFLVRARGGMWKEYRDQRHEDPIYKAVPYSFSKEKIRDLNLHNSDGIIPVSYFHKLQIVEESNIDPNKCSVVHTPLDFERFEGNKPDQSQNHVENINTDHKTILSITSYKYKNKRQGVLNFSEPIVRFLEKYPNWSFIVCGPGKPSHVRTHFKNIATKQVLDRIHILGYQENIEELYRISDIYLHLSFRDSMGMTILEAQAAGNPVIINNSGGPVDLIRQQNTEVKMIVNTDEELINSLTELADNSGLRSTVGEKNQRWVKNNFTYEKVARDFDDSISELLRCYPEENPQS